MSILCFLIALMGSVPASVFCVAMGCDTIIALAYFHHIGWF